MTKDIDEIMCFPDPTGTNAELKTGGTISLETRHLSFNSGVQSKNAQCSINSKVPLSVKGRGVEEL